MDSKGAHVDSQNLGEANAVRDFRVYFFRSRLNAALLFFCDFILSAPLKETLRATWKLDVEQSA